MRPVIIFIGLILIISATAARVADPFVTQTVRSIYFDSLQQVFPRQFDDGPVRVVDIDEASLAEIGQWPWPRTQLATLVKRLNAYGAAVIAFDILFAEPDRYSPKRLLDDPTLGGLINQPTQGAAPIALDNDLVFAEAMAAANVVVGIAEALDGEHLFAYEKAGFVEIGQSPSLGLYPLSATTALVESLGTAAVGIGGINVSPVGQTNVVRTVPLIWRTDAGMVPSLSLEALRVALGESTFIVNGSQSLEGIVESIRLGPFFVPTTDEGNFWVRYRRDDSALYVSAKDVLQNSDNAEIRAALEGSIVLIGTSAAGLFDIRSTPLGENIPGVSVHAQVIEQILQGEFLYRSDFVSGMEVLAFIFVGALVTLVMARFSAMSAVVAGIAAAIVLLVTSVALFLTQGVLFDVTFPLFGGAANFGILAGYQFISVDKEKRVLRTLFSHYVSPTVLKEMEDDDYAVELGGETRTVTIMFCDVRNFTKLSENMDPADLVGLLNRLFTSQTKAILDQQGTIDKFMGDAIMAFWNAPLALPDHERRACLAMLEMRAALKRFNASPEMEGHDPISTGMGCATGDACVGNIGSADRFNYSAIGDTVNTASRVETSCRAIDYDIVVLRHTTRKAQDLAVLDAGRIDVKGKSERLAVDVLVGDAAMAASDDYMQLKKMHGDLVALLGSGKMSTKSKDLIKKCGARAAGIEPGLEKFYARIAERPGDYRA
ncbi:MAG: adenylate/guanylate cyclase domain-containing protein [Pseudomonadota bacterium]